MRRNLRTRSLRRKKTSSPVGRSIIRFSSSLSAPPRCHNCGRELHGIPRRRAEPQPRSMKSVNRVFGGVLCGRCARESIKADVAKIWKIEL